MAECHLTYILTEMDRKNFLKSAFSTAVLLTGIDSLAQAGTSVNSLLQPAPPFTLPPLAYGFDALEPHIDKLTMEIHHDRHHKAYVDNLNKAVEGNSLAKLTLDEIVKSAGKHPAAVRNNGGGHWNHTFFWQILGPAGSDRASGGVADAIDKAFGTEIAFR